MKAYLKILSFLMLVLLLTAEDCGDSGNSYVAREDVFQTIENEFTGDEISPETRIAFEKRAIQKLKDITDYINIYADSGYSVDFRLQASQMIKDAFYSEQDMQEFYINQGITEDTINHLLLATGGDMIHARVDSLNISRKIHRTSVNDYEGEICFNFYYGGKVSKEQLKIFAKKDTRQFGENSLDVWKLYFKL